MYMSLDDAERAAHAKLDDESAQVWAAWVAGDLDAAEHLDALSDEQRTLTMTALRLKPTARPSQHLNQLTVTFRSGDGLEVSAGEKLIRRHQDLLDKNPAASPFPPMRSNPAARSTAPPAARQTRDSPAQHRSTPPARSTTHSGVERPRSRTAASNNTTALIAWVLIVIGVVSVLIAQVLGRDSVDVGFGVSLTAQEPWAQPLTWGGAALAVIGIAMLLTRTRTGSGTGD